MWRKENFRWLPNAITGLRIMAGAAAMVYAVQEVWVTAFWIFMAALLSDFLDGLAAKKLNAATKLGEVLDSLADGWLVACGLIGLSATGHLSWWVAGIAFAVGVGVQAERRLLPRKLRVSAAVKKMFAVACLFAAWIYIVLSFAALAYGWQRWYVPATVSVLVASALLKTHRLRNWLAGRS